MRRAPESRMFPALLLAVTALMTASAAVALEPLAPQQVFDREDLQAAGVLRLTDILGLVETWRLSSLDAFTWNSTGGRGGFTEPGWTVFVEDQQIPLEMLGNLGLNRLPLSPDDIESVEVYDAAVHLSGGLHAGGVLRIRLRSPGQGPWGRGRVSWGQETGDPGPYRFLGPDTPNVEHLGPSAYATAGWAVAGKQAGAGLALLHHAWTDPNIVQRLSAFGAENLIEDALEGATLRAGWQREGHRQDFHLALSEQEDFFYYAPLGRDYPSLTTLRRMGLSGELPLSPTWRLGYGLGLSENGTDDFTHRVGFRFDYRIERWRGHLELERQGDRSALLLTLVQRRTAAQWDLEGGGRRSHRFGEFGLVHEWRYSRSLRQRAAVQLVSHEEGIAPRLTLSAAWQPVESQQVLAQWSYIERHRADLGGAWTWIRAGYPLHPAYSDHDRRQTDRRGSLELHWTAQLPRRFETELRVFWQRDDWRFWAEQEYRPRSGTAPYSEAAVLYGGLHGDLVGLQAAVEKRWRRTAKLRLAYSQVAASSRDERFESAYGNLPTHRLRAALSGSPRPSFHMGAALDHCSSSLWSQWYADTTGESGQAVTSDLPSFTTVDLVLRKELWRRRLGLRFIFRNLFGAKTQTHPIGGQEGFSFHLDIQLRLPGPAPPLTE